jgi:hypothetical protein
MTCTTSQTLARDGVMGSGDLGANIANPSNINEKGIETTPIIAKDRRYSTIPRYANTPKYTNAETDS